MGGRTSNTSIDSCRAPMLAVVVISVKHAICASMNMTPMMIFLGDDLRSRPISSSFSRAFALFSDIPSGGVRASSAAAAATGMVVVAA